MRRGRIIQVKVAKEHCSGCLSCLAICSMVNEGYSSVSSSRVRVSLRPFSGDHQIQICEQCTEAACAEACPWNAISRDPSSGSWCIDYGRCDGCRLCVDNCAHSALFWDRIKERVIKCELCDGVPRCVEACPTGALWLSLEQRTMAVEDQGDVVL